MHSTSHPDKQGIVEQALVYLSRGSYRQSAVWALIACGFYALGIMLYIYTKHMIPIIKWLNVLGSIMYLLAWLAYVGANRQ